MAVDHWEVNGEVADSQGRRYSLEFTANGTTIVAAVLRQELAVTSINAVMQFLDDNGNPAGPTFTKFVFEDDYINEANGRIYPRGTITVLVRADIPAGYEVDYWLINGVPYFYNYPVSAFVVVNQDATTEYEVVLKTVGSEGTSFNSLTTPSGTTPVIEGDIPWGWEGDDETQPTLIPAVYTTPGNEEGHSDDGDDGDGATATSGDSASSGDSSATSGDSSSRSDSNATSGDSGSSGDSGDDDVSFFTSDGNSGGSGNIIVSGGDSIWWGNNNNWPVNP